MTWNSITFRILDQNPIISILLGVALNVNHLDLLHSWLNLRYFLLHFNQSHSWQNSFIVQPIPPSLIILSWQNLQTLTNEKEVWNSMIWGIQHNVEQPSILLCISLGPTLTSLPKRHFGWQYMPIDVGLLIPPNSLVLSNLIHVIFPVGSCPSVSVNFDIFSS